MIYPKREPFFAHRFVRVLQKSCAAQDIGRDAIALLCFIAHTEDAARYKGPVRFWNEQLMTTLAFNNRRQLNNCRQRAIDHGWLVYTRKHDRAVGNYFVQIPEQFSDIPDTEIEPIGDCLCDSGATGSVHKVSQEMASCDSGATQSVRKVSQEAYGNRTESVTPPNPLPFPNPFPKEREEFSPLLNTASFIDIRSPLSGLDPLKFCSDLVQHWNGLPEVTKYGCGTLRGPDIKELSLRLADPEWHLKFLKATAKFPLANWPGENLIPLSSILREGCVEKILDGNYDATNKRKNGTSRVGPGQVFDPNAGKDDPTYGKF